MCSINAHRDTAMFQPPKPINLGSVSSSVIDACLARLRNATEEPESVLEADRYAMGAPLPSWQREACWSQDQQIRLIESIWVGIPIGFYVINKEDEDDSGTPREHSGVLIDGQQRMLALEAYFNNEFKVYGGYWRDVPLGLQRQFRRTHFPYYETDIWDEEQLRDLYNRLNFGGVAHREDQRA